MKDTAFYKYLKRLPLDLRAQHLIDCGLNGGELYYELAEYYKEYSPLKLAELMEDEFYGEDN